MSDDDKAAPPKKCPKCLRLVRQLPETTARGCAQCGRWQFLYQAPFVAFHGAVHQHLACVQCGLGAWCRDMREGGSDAVTCAREVHVHPPGACSGPKPGEFLASRRA